jgi:tetratricopeptide (TPR) repeat protein
VVNVNIKLGRNDPCSCGSGRKFKHCCGQVETPVNRDAGQITAAESELIRLVGAARYADAERGAHALLARWPASPQAWLVLGQALWMQGKDALPALRKAAELLPGDADAQGNLGTALLARGQAAEAQQCYQRALRLRPDFAAGHNNLGSALRDLGELQQAASSYRRALQLKPDLAVAHCNLAHVCRLQGELLEAHAHYSTAAKLQPDLADAHAGLGNTLQDLGRHEQALEAHRRRLELQPNAAEALLCVGNALLDLWRLDEAEICYRRALERRADYAEVHDKLSIALRLQGRADEALASCRRALELNPNLVEALVSAAQFCADRGDFGEAESTFKRATALAPTSPEALAGIAGLRKMTLADGAWAEQAQHTASLPLAPRRAAKLRYAIGKYFDDVGDAEQAFGNYHAANQLSRSAGAVYDRGHIERETDGIIRLFDHEWLEGHRNLDNRSTRPVLIVGMPRSGTTLTEQILAAHPVICGAGEVPFWLPACRRHIAANEVTGLTRTDFERLARAYSRLLDRHSSTAAHVIDKMPANYNCLALIHAAFPQARLIHVSRHPLDTCLSIYFQDFNTTHSYANDLDDLAHYYRQYNRLMSHWREVLPSDALLEIRYEGLVHDQETSIRRLLQFIGVPWDARCLEFNNANRSVNSILTFSQWQARQKISKASVARWRKYEKFIGPLLPLGD